MKIAFIGGGNMGEAMLAAVLEDGLARPEAIWVSDVSLARRRALVQKYGVAAMAGNLEAIKGKEIVVLAVKPQDLDGVMAKLSGSDFRGANLTNADFTPLESRAGQGTITTLAKNVLKSCDFSAATMKGAILTRADLTFSRFVGTDLTGADLTNADLSMVDFTGADMTGADLTGADLYGARLTGVRGLDTVKGLSATANLDKATR